MPSSGVLVGERLAQQGCWCSRLCRAARGSGPGRSRGGAQWFLEGGGPGDKPVAPVHGERAAVWGARAPRLSGETSAARLEGALGAHQVPGGPVDQGDQYSAAHTARDGVALPVTHPFTPVGDGGPLAQLVGDRDPAPPVETALPAAPPVAQSGAHLLVPAESVIQQAAVDRPEGWLCRPPPGRGARVMMRPSIRTWGSRCRFPYQPGHQLQAPGIGQQGLAAAPPRPALALVVGGARPVAPHPARHRAVPPAPADLARHRGLVPADKAGRSRSPPHGSSSGP